MNKITSIVSPYNKSMRNDKFLKEIQQSFTNDGYDIENINGKQFIIQNH